MHARLHGPAQLYSHLLTREHLQTDIVLLM